MNGVTFGNYHSWNDWKLVRQSKEIGFPTPKTNVIDIPGTNGSLDLTEALTGTVVYKNRTLKFTFVTTEHLSGKGWADLISTIAAALHGLRLNIVLDDDPDWTYNGRCTIDEFSTSQALQTITITCDCDPYKTNSNGEKLL